MCMYVCSFNAFTVEVIKSVRSIIYAKTTEEETESFTKQQFSIQSALKHQ